ncbi:hypothetical protein V5O48_006479 [Marasmius crinis-equi]|uniref:Restriction endonuclease type IV Mrr domain-containing protein n=1 Tax=Marasmius crinis-equi TaxID=585013 RepID=A0ABR3FJL2_9AGAR
MSTSGIINKIVDWGNANGDKLEAAYGLHGGWEGWVQVELAIAFKRAFESENPGSTITVTREDSVYGGTNQRSDILITTRGGGRDFTNMLELKCESIAGAAGFSGQVKGDCDKVDKGLINNQFKPCKAWIIAFSVTKDLSNLKVDNKNLVAYPKQIRAGRLTITLWWGAKDFA